MAAAGGQPAKEVIDAQGAQELLEQNYQHFATLLAADGTHPPERLEAASRQLQENLKLLAAAADKVLPMPSGGGAGGASGAAGQAGAPGVKQEHVGGQQMGHGQGQARAQAQAQGQHPPAQQQPQQQVNLQQAAQHQQQQAAQQQAAQAQMQLLQQMGQVGGLK